jgi:hypothetical protein
MRKFKLLGGFAFLMMFSIASSQANAQDWGGVVGGLAGGMIAGAIIEQLNRRRWEFVPSTGLRSFDRRPAGSWRHNGSARTHPV